MKTQINAKPKDEDIKFMRYKKLIRSLRRGKDEKVSFKQINNSISKE